MWTNIVKFAIVFLPKLGKWFKVGRQVAEEFPSFKTELDKLLVEVREVYKDKKVSPEEALGLVDNIEGMIKETYELIEPFKELKK